MYTDFLSFIPFDVISYNSLIQETLFSPIINFKRLASCWLRGHYIINCSLQVKQISFKDRFSFYCLTLDWTFVINFCTCGWQAADFGGHDILVHGFQLAVT